MSWSALTCGIADQDIYISFPSLFFSIFDVLGLMAEKKRDDGPVVIGDRQYFYNPGIGREKLQAFGELGIVKGNIQTSLTHIYCMDGKRVKSEIDLGALPGVGSCDAQQCRGCLGRLTVDEQKKQYVEQAISHFRARLKEYYLFFANYIPRSTGRERPV